MDKTIFKSIISHDYENNRVYLMNLDPDDFPDIISYIEELANTHQYSKLFIKIPAKYSPAFLASGYTIEATIPGFYNSQEDAFFLVKYKSEERSYPETGSLFLLQELFLKPISHVEKDIDNNYSIRALKEEDTDIMVPIFKEVFETYPFPIFSQSYLKKSMSDLNTIYFGAFYYDELVAISSAECNYEKSNAEMTDFAVLQSHRGKGLSTYLLSFMENSLSQNNYKTLYSIARLYSLPMNKTFYNQGYKYAGTLTRNTQISGRIESMNVWYKKI